MNFYTQQHRYYCGIDLHTREMYGCILDAEGQIRLHQNIKANPDCFIRILTLSRENIVVGVECMFIWYLIADLHVDQNTPSF